MLTPDRLIPALVEGGVVARRELVHGRVLLEPVGRSHAVYRLRVDGAPRAAVKLFGPSRGATDGEARRERAVAALAARLPALGAVTAVALPCDGPEELVVTEWVAGEPAWRRDGDDVSGDPGAAARFDFAALVDALAPPLARAHAAAAALARDGALDPALTGPAPWGLRLFDGDAPADVWQHPGVAPLLVQLGRTPTVVEGTRRARGAWRARTLVHGDLKHDNVIVADDGRVVVVDWEMARIGDPAWDLAALLARPLLAAATRGDDAWGAATVALAARLAGLYAVAAGLPVPAVAQRLALYGAVWLVVTAVQHAAAQNRADSPVLAPVMAAAGAGFARADYLTAAIARAA